MRVKKLLLLSFLVITASFHLLAQDRQVTKYYPVVRVIDGDTFRVADGTVKGMVVRLIGIDAPESRNSRNKVKHELGAEATAYLQRLLSGKRIRLEYDIDKTDRYGRTLAYAYLEDGTFINAEIIRNGYATIMTIPPNIKYQELFLKLERRARNSNKGLWSK